MVFQRRTNGPKCFASAPGQQRARPPGVPTGTTTKGTSPQGHFFCFIESLETGRSLAPGQQRARPQGETNKNNYNIENHNTRQQTINKQALRQENSERVAKYCGCLCQRLLLLLLLLPILLLLLLLSLLSFIITIISSSSSSSIIIIIIYFWVSRARQENSERIAKLRINDKHTTMNI